MLAYNQINAKTTIDSKAEPNYELKNKPKVNHSHAFNGSFGRRRKSDKPVVELSCKELSNKIKEIRKMHFKKANGRSSRIHDPSHSIENSDTLNEYRELDDETYFNDLGKAYECRKKWM